jgi:anti-sigma regulatory factor (Ser/Thr protein kinase)
VAEVTSEARVVALDRRWPDDMANRNGELLDIVFGWPDCTRLRRLVAGRCAAAGLQGSRLDDFVLAVHEIAANAIVHAGQGGRLTLHRAADGLRCMIADHQEPAPTGRVPRARDGSARPAEGLHSPWDTLPCAEAEGLGTDQASEPVGAETGRGLWLAAQLADELSITAGPDSTTVSLFIRFD